ncbi:dUTP pyrophosphatase [Acanthocystis turfacea Chlorella virus MO0605SPH]|nr:dUTP pyrophosphatase [Acanthocystis turfacea Chlorella virus MO0605SPH]AGE57024.1 dUTP pyrophosphatase [Acanthocystis turfacea Chlorella virus NE-JV-3]
MRQYVHIVSPVVMSWRGKCIVTMSSLFVKKLDESAVVPTRGTALSAGYDLSSVADVVVPSLGRVAVPTGLAIKVPANTYGRIAPRSGLAFKHGIDVLAGVVDADYRAEVKVILYNTSGVDYEIKKGDRIAQLVIEKIEMLDVAVVDDLEETSRTGGFGSTGR